jgi:hypothetical protein
VTWQVGLVLIAVVGWYALHPWLGRKGYRRLLGLSIVVELTSFAALSIHLAREAEKFPSAGMATGLIWFAGLFALVFPAAFGAFALWKYRRGDAAQNTGIN